MVAISKILHKGAERIKIEAPNTPEYNAKIRQIPGRTFSASLQCWHVPYSRVSFDTLQKLFGPENLSYTPRQEKEISGGYPEKTSLPAKDSPGLTVYKARPKNTKNAAVENSSVPGNAHTTQDEGEKIKGSLPIVVLQPVFVHKQERILFKGTYPRRLDNLILKKVPGARYSDSLKGWHVPLNEAVYKEARLLLNGNAIPDTTLLKAYLLRRKLVEQTSPVPISPQTTAERTWQSGKISTQNLEALTRLVQQLVLEGLSKNTIKTYRSEFNQFLYWAGTKPVNELNANDLRSYMEYCLQELKISKNSAHSRLNALKAYYEKVLKRDKFFHEIPRPKKHKALPKVLSEEELGRLFTAVRNIKYKAILFTAYSAGLRISEVCGLRQEDVDRDRMELFIYRGKGDKDRVVPLSPIVSDILKKYLEPTKKKPLKYIFEGDIPGRALSHKSASKSFKDAKNASEILKSVTFHSLRHSFATHMLEKGVSTRYIQEILGHHDIKTTERYLHVARTKLINLPSPMDDLWLKGGMEF